MNSGPSTLRITLLSQGDGSAKLKIEGRIGGADVALLDQEIRTRLEEVERIVLDLTGLKHIDRQGLETLKKWPGERLAFRGFSPFVRSLLDTHGLLSGGD
jgi:hypothetical protein